MMGMDIPDQIAKKVHECRPQPNMCLHVAHNADAADYWEVREIPDNPPFYFWD